MAASEEDYLPLSGLQHVVFCERQAALIHVERIWADDAATTAGNLLHERVDDPGAKDHGGVRVVRAHLISSDRLRVFGIADMVELHRDPTAPRGARPIPVELKRGKLKRQRADQVQLCAQAICLEEQYGVEIPFAWLSYAGSHRRLKVVLDVRLRAETAQAAKRFAELIFAARLPRAVYVERKCARCSLAGRCLPQVTQSPEMAARALERIQRRSE